MLVLSYVFEIQEAHFKTLFCMADTRFWMYYLCCLPAKAVKNCHGLKCCIPSTQLADILQIKRQTGERASLYDL